MEFIANSLSKDAWVNIMAQYYPAYKSWDYPELSRRITNEEYWEVVRYAAELGIHRGIPFTHRS
jgi:putative pyruvate formate lyase activating enzyme